MIPLEENETITNEKIDRIEPKVRMKAQVQLLYGTINMGHFDIGEVQF